MPLENTLLSAQPAANPATVDRAQATSRGLGRMRSNPMARDVMGDNPSMHLAMLILASTAFLAALHMSGFRSTITIGK